MFSCSIVYTAPCLAYLTSPRGHGNLVDDHFLTLGILGLVGHVTLFFVFFFALLILPHMEEALFGAEHTTCHLAGLLSYLAWG